MKKIITLISGVAFCVGAVFAENAPQLEPIFNGKDLTGWKGVEGYKVDSGVITCCPGGKNLMTEQVYENYIIDFEFRLTPGANSGLGIHYPGTGDPAYTGMELQILDDTAEKFAKLQPYQYHGSLYTMSAAKRGFLKPVGEWNKQTVTVNGPLVKVVLNGEVILDVNLDEMNAKYPAHVGGKRRSGHITWCGHGDGVSFKEIKLVKLPATAK